MRLLLGLACTLAFIAIGVHGHGVIYEPPARGSMGWYILGPGCAGGSCLYFNQGTSIGCPNATGNGTVFPAECDCAKTTGCDEATIGRFDEKLRTVFTVPEFDWTKWHPWRKPGSAPVENPCGLAGGWYTPGSLGNGGEAPPGVAQGFKGTEQKPLFKETKWVAGGTAEVVWGIYANHGGGYQYRLCPAHLEPTEGCFQHNPLTLIGDTQWLQFGHGQDVNNRTEIPAARVTNGTVPKGSQWTRNPIPACGGIEDAISLGAMNTPCNKPQFPAPIEGIFGFGGGACASGVPGTACDPAQFKEKTFDFGIVDKVQVPNLPEGKYVLSFRWESEQTPQVWSSCADVTIIKSGEGTKPFQPYEGCEICCGSIKDGGTCANCTKCANDKTGNCKYCWDELKGYNPGILPQIHCMGYDDPVTGGPTKYFPGDQIKGAHASPGCTRCWKNNACDKMNE